MFVAELSAYPRAIVRIQCGESNMKTKFVCGLAVLLLWLAPAQAQQSTLYGPDGRVRGRSVTDSQGTTTHYDAAGRKIGSATTNLSTGTVTVYGQDGRRIGTSTRPTEPRSGRR